MAKLDLVGIDEIAQRLGVSRSKVSVWQQRGWPPGQRGADVDRPEPVAVISKRISVYLWRDVERWADETGRLP
jgi:hypothetical protein